jgi:hypothetical protein
MVLSGDIMIKKKFCGSSTFGLGFILFYACYIAVLSFALPSIAPGLFKGAPLTNAAPGAPSDIITYVINLGTQLWITFEALFTFSLSVPWLGFLNFTFTIGAIVMGIMIIRGN